MRSACNRQDRVRARFLTGACVSLSSGSSLPGDRSACASTTRCAGSSAPRPAIVCIDALRLREIRYCRSSVGSTSSLRQGTLGSFRHVMSPAWHMWCRLRERDACSVSLTDAQSAMAGAVHSLHACAPEHPYIAVVRIASSEVQRSGALSLTVWFCARRLFGVRPLRVTERAADVQCNREGEASEDI
jgi:hypothetical protein